MLLKITIFLLSLLLSAHRIDAASEIVSDRAESMEVVIHAFIHAEAVKVNRISRPLEVMNFALRENHVASSTNVRSIVIPNLVIKLRRILI